MVNSSNLRKIRIYACFTLAFVVLVIVWGAYVRATGSGAGCGEHWPLCNGEIVPQDPGIKTMVEYSHRLSSGLSLLFVLGLYVWTRKIFPKGNFTRKAAGIAAIAIILEAFIGAALVLLRLVENDESVRRVISIALHLVNTLFLVATLTLVADSVSMVNPKWKIPFTKQRRRATLFLGSFLILAALGAMTALGDTLFRPSSFQAGFLAHWNEQAHITERLRIFHPLFAILWVFLLVPWFGDLKDQVPGLSHRTKLCLVFAFTNLILGTLNVVLLAPLWLQMVHLLMANLVWISFVQVLFFTASKWRG